MNKQKKEQTLLENDNIFTFDEDDDNDDNDIDNEKEEIEQYQHKQSQQQQHKIKEQQNQHIHRLKKDKQQNKHHKHQYNNDDKHQLNNKSFNTQQNQNNTKQSVDYQIFLFENQYQNEDNQDQNQNNQSNKDDKHQSNIINNSSSQTNASQQQTNTPQQQTNTPQQQTTQFNSLKNKILFKQHNNFINQSLINNSQISQNQSHINHNNFINNQSNFINNQSNFINNQSNFINNHNNFINNHSNFINNHSNLTNISNNPSLIKKNPKINQQKNHKNQPKTNNQTNPLNQNQSKYNQIQSTESFNKNNSTLTINQHFQNFLENQNLKQTYSIQGAKISPLQLNTPQRFQYVQQQKAIKVANLKQFLFTQLSDQYKVNLLIKKVDQGGFLGKIVNKTKYFVTIEQNNKFLFSVTKEGINKFIFSMNKDDISSKNKNYLGQLISKDFSNTEFNLYDFGFDPKETKCLQFSYKQLAWIKYQESSGPRKFNVTISTNNEGFHSIQNDVNVIQKKWTEQKNRKNLSKFYSKEPELDQTDGNFKLDFKGMVGKPSVKNFILSSEEFEDCLIFARRSEDIYALEVRNPFSLIQAVAICISSIYHKTVF